MSYIVPTQVHMHTHPHTHTLQRLTDGQVSSAGRDKPTFYRRIDKSEADTDRLQCHHNDRQVGATGGRLEFRADPSGVICLWLTVNPPRHPSDLVGRHSISVETLVTERFPIALTLASSRTTTGNFDNRSFERTSLIRYREVNKEPI